MKISPTESYSIQIYKGTNGELIFEKSEEALFRITLNKDGKLFVADDLPEKLFKLFLSRINNGKIVETIEDLIVLLS